MEQQIHDISNQIVWEYLAKWDHKIKGYKKKFKKEVNAIAFDNFTFDFVKSYKDKISMNSYNLIQWAYYQFIERHMKVNVVADMTESFEAADLGKLVTTSVETANDNYIYNSNSIFTEQMIDKVKSIRCQLTPLEQKILDHMLEGNYSDGNGKRTLAKIRKLLCISPKGAKF
ncbi:MAG: hypothetical protein LBV53_02520 [Mycoplasmataceae bacterium]|nr:hypothetical protein [Mycoplasmataceae bacterium]